MSTILFHFVFCRLWQFFFGIIVVYAVEFAKLNDYEEKTIKLLSDKNHIVKLNDNRETHQFKEINLKSQSEKEKYVSYLKKILDKDSIKLLEHAIRLKLNYN